MVSGTENQTTIESNPFSKEQMEVLQRLFNQPTQSPIASTIETRSLAHKGNFRTALNVKKENSNSWIVNSAASDHMTGDIKLFKTYNPCYGNSNVWIADGLLSKVAGIGSVVISEEITLHTVLLVPNLDCNLLSISKLTQDLKTIAKFFPGYCEFQDSVSGRMIGSAKVCSGLYILEANNCPDRQFQSAEHVSLKSQFSLCSNDNKDSSIMMWHYRLGHLNFMYLEKIFPSLYKNKNPNSFLCEICQLAKHTRQPFPNHLYKSSHPFSINHSDVWGPSRVNNITGTKWFVSFIDDHTRITWLFLIKEKSEVGKIFKNFHSMIKTQFQARIQVLRTDNGKEYFNSILGNYLLDEGIIHQSSYVDTPRQNGVSERKNRHILEVARSLMFTANVPKNF